MLAVQDGLLITVRLADVSYADVQAISGAVDAWARHPQLLVRSDRLGAARLA